MTTVDVLATALAVVLRDAPEGLDVRLVHEAVAEGEPALVWLMLNSCGSGMQLSDLWVGCNGTIFDVVVGQEDAPVLALIADTLQELLMEDGAHERGRAVAWPTCPEHPDGQPMSAVVLPDGAAWWRCPKLKKAVCRVGSFRPHDSRP